MSGVGNMASITNEALAVEIKNLAVQIADLKSIIAQNASTYVSKDMYELRHAELERDIVVVRADILKLQKDIQAELLKLQNKKNLLNWVLPTVSAVLGSVMTYLVIQELGR